MSADITLLTIGGEDKTSCRTGDVKISLPDGTTRWHGPLSWLFGQALLNTAPQSTWIQILSEMERLTQEQGWQQPLLFCGQPTQTFGL
ncbi:MAG: hypothetical protein ACPGWR_29120 [Ardenticatenaceae bacterium]